MLSFYYRYCFYTDSMNDLYINLSEFMIFHWLAVLWSCHFIVSYYYTKQKSMHSRLLDALSIIMLFCLPSCILANWYLLERQASN